MLKISRIILRYTFTFHYYNHLQKVTVIKKKSFLILGVVFITIKLKTVTKNEICVNFVKHHLNVHIVVLFNSSFMLKLVKNMKITGKTYLFILKTLRQLYNGVL